MFGRKLLALTFDDGPAERTPAILDLLDEHGAKATFFVLGRQIAGREHILLRMREAGHEIGNHSFDHPRFETAEADSLGPELSRASEAIASVTGQRPLLMRPPYGEGDRLHGLARDLGMQTVRWTINPRDWEAPSADVLARMLIDGARRNGVVVMHDGAAHGGKREMTVNALRTAVPVWLDAGYELVTMSTLLRRAPWSAHCYLIDGRGRPGRAVASLGRVVWGRARSWTSIARDATHSY